MNKHTYIFFNYLQYTAENVLWNAMFLQICCVVVFNAKYQWDDAVYGGSAIHKTIKIMNSLACFWFCTNYLTKIWTIKYNTKKKVKKYCTKICRPTPDASVKKLTENKHAHNSWMKRKWAKQTGITFPQNRDFSQILTWSFFPHPRAWQQSHKSLKNGTRLRSSIGIHC